MSDSIPKTNAGANKPPGPKLNQRKKPKATPKWWLMSFVFHTLLLGWLACFSPVRIIDLQKSRAEYTAGTERIREVMDEVRERQADVLAFSVRSLQDIQLELNELEARKYAEFAKFSTEFAQDAPELAEQAQENAAKAQVEALGAQTQAEPALDKARQSQQPEDFKALDGVQKSIESAQDRVSQPQERALQALAMSDAHYESARQAQADANAIQQRANKAQMDANSARENAQYSRSNAQSKQREAERFVESVKKIEGEVDSAKTNVAKAQSDAAQAKSDAEQAQTVAVQTKANAEQAKTAADQAKADYDKLGAKDPNKKTLRESSSQAQTKASAARREADQAQSKANAARSKVESAQRKIEQAQAHQQRTEDRLKEQNTRLERIQAEASQAGTNAMQMEVTLAQAQAEAKRLQTEAQKVQANARQVLASARLSAATNLLATLTNAFELPTNTLASLPNVYDMNLADLYQAAVNAEGEFTETYKRIRATELAMLRKIPLARAMALTDVAKVVRPNLKPALQATVNSGEDVPGAREAIQTASSEINAMVTLGTSLLEQAKGLDHSGSASGEGASISLDWVNAQSAQMEAMEGLAAEDSEQRAKDLSAAMQGTGQAGQSGTGKPGAGAGKGTAGVLGGGLPGGRGGPGGFGYGGPPTFPKKLNALPGRKVKADAPASEWLYVDSWYIIGPFDNPRRENIEKKFPPETVVDLNATYVGKDNETIRWEFYQAGSPDIKPPFDRFRHGKYQNTEFQGLEYIIYYAYTELYFEKACDLWIAIGSDDFSKVWIEDQLVWASGKQQKSWRVDEGLRKVHFRQGLNRILYRIENGWHGTDFSLVICLR